MTHASEHFPGGPSAAITRALEEQKREFAKPHHPLPLALALQFYGGDKTAAIELARLLTDIEPEPRRDVALVFVMQAGTPLDDEIAAGVQYAMRRFPVSVFPSPRCRGTGYPGECFDIWAETVKHLSDRYYEGAYPFSDAFLFEADGCPMSTDWIDRIKQAHAETVLLGKRVTGPVMRFPNHHVNGTMVIDLSLWEDTPSLHRCPPAAGWDCFHGRTMVREAGPSRIIENLYGMQGMSESVWWTLSREAAWVTSVKDGLHQHHARRLLVKSSPKWRNSKDHGTWGKP